MIIKNLFTKVKHFVTQYDKGYLPTSVKNRCCNFRLLEIKYKEYIDHIL